MRLVASIRPHVCPSLRPFISTLTPEPKLLHPGAVLENCATFTMQSNATATGGAEFSGLPDEIARIK